MRHHLILVLCCCWLRAVALDLDALEISGAETFTAESIRSALRLDPNVGNARRAGLPDWKVFQLVCHRVRTGYLRHGFADASVQPDYDQGMAIVITEYRRYSWRTLAVDAPADIDAGLIRQIIVDPPAPTLRNREVDAQTMPTRPAYQHKRPDPLWTAGEPARCDGYYRATLERRVRRCCLEELGIDAEVGVDQELLDDTSVATTVTLRPRTNLPVIAEIRLTGLERNRPDDVERWLDEHCGLAVGRPASAVALHALRRGLEDSGRTVSFQASYREREAGDGVALLLEIIEDETLPPLTAEPTPLQTFCLDLRNRILQLHDHPDLHVTLSGTGIDDGVHGRIHGVYRHGMIDLRTTWRRGEAGEELAWGCRLATNHFVLWSGHDRHLLRGTPPTLYFQPQITYTTQPNPNGQISRLKFSSQFSARQSASRPLLLHMTPAAFMTIAGRIAQGDTAVELTEDATGATLTGPDWSLFLGTDQQQSLRLNLTDPEQDGRLEMTASLRPDAELPDLPGGENWREDRGGERSAMHLLGFAHQALESIVAAELLPDDKAEQAHRWLERAGGTWIWIAAALDAYLELVRAAREADLEDEEDAREDFRIPFEPREVDPRQQIQRMLTQAVDGLDHLVIWRRDSWPERLTRLAIHSLSGQRQELIANVTALQADRRMGPWGNLAATMATRQIGHPARAFFARRATDHLDAEAAWRDLLELTCGPEPLVDWLRRVEPIPTAVAPFPVPERNAIAAMLRALRDAPDDPSRQDLVRRLFGLAWKARLRDLTAESIETLAKRKVEIP